VWRAHWNPCLIGLAQASLFQLERAGRCGAGLIGRPVADAVNRFAQALDLGGLPLVVPCPGTVEMLLEQHAELAEALRAEDWDEETFDLALTAGGAAVLLLVDDAGLSADYDI
jgi:hypothetical protein